MKLTGGTVAVGNRDTEVCFDPDVVHRTHGGEGLSPIRTATAVAKQTPGLS